MLPMVDLQRQYRNLKPEIDAAVQEVMNSTQFILGPNVSRLEGEIAGYHGASFAAGVASGTDALLLALRACGIGEGDEVITTPFTFIATAEVIALLKAVPVFADITPDTFNIDPAKVEEKITSRTKAIIPVHLFGNPADMDPLLSTAERHRLAVVEDCAQAFGAEYKGRKVGTFGDYGCFSFFPSKNLACCGDGGMVITRHEDAAGRIRLLRNHGSRVKYHHETLGYNSRLDEIQAAIVRVKLKRLDEWNAARRKNAGLYRRYIRNAGVLLPLEAEEGRHVYHQFTIRSAKRDRIMAALNESGISSAVYYPLPLHLQEVFAYLGYRESDLPNSERCAKEVISLPMFPELTEDEIRRVSDVINHVS
jgi:dTDP-4-amino-4,6-dideoxygalactose transaminase